MNEYLNILSKELKKEYGRKAQFELILIGGACIVFEYHFRDASTDMDGFIRDGYDIKDVINRCVDQYDFPSGWLNSEFTKTSSYSPNLYAYSKFYKTYNQILTVRLIVDEYLIAMKLKSFRDYKRDQSDIVGIINENKEITIDSIKNAVIDLYGNESAISKDGWEFIENIYHKDDLKSFYKEVITNESYVRSRFIDIE